MTKKDYQYKINKYITKFRKIIVDKNGGGDDDDENRFRKKQRTQSPCVLLSRLDFVYEDINIIKSCLNNLENPCNTLLNQLDESGSTFLHRACQYGTSQVVNLILDECKVNSSLHPLLSATDENGYTPLHMACNPDAYYSPYHPIHYPESGEVVRLILDACRVSSSEDPLLTAITTNFGYTPFHLACISGESLVVRIILDACNVNSSTDPLLVAKDKYGCTPFHLACTSGKLLIVRFILDACNVNSSTDPLLVAENNQGHTALYDSCQNGNLDVVKLILDAAKVSSIRDPLIFPLKDLPSCKLFFNRYFEGAWSEHGAITPDLCSTASENTGSSSDFGARMPDVSGFGGSPQRK